jgi:hypothetical protein
MIISKIAGSDSFPHKLQTTYKLTHYSSDIQLGSQEYMLLHAKNNFMFVKK